MELIRYIFLAQLFSMVKCSSNCTENMEVFCAIFIPTEKNTTSNAPEVVSFSTRAAHITTILPFNNTTNKPGDIDPNDKYIWIVCSLVVIMVVIIPLISSLGYFLFCKLYNKYKVNRMRRGLNSERREQFMGRGINLSNNRNMESIEIHKLRHQIPEHNYGTKIEDLLYPDSINPKSQSNPHLFNDESGNNKDQGHSLKQHKSLEAILSMPDQTSGPALALKAMPTLHQLRTRQFKYEAPAMYSLPPNKRPKPVPKPRNRNQLPNDYSIGMFSVPPTCKRLPIPTPRFQNKNRDFGLRLLDNTRLITEKIATKSVSTQQLGEEEEPYYKVPVNDVNGKPRRVLGISEENLSYLLSDS